MSFTITYVVFTAVSNLFFQHFMRKQREMYNYQLLYTLEKWKTTAERPLKVTGAAKKKKSHCTRDCTIQLITRPCLLLTFSLFVSSTHVFLRYCFFSPFRLLLLLLPLIFSYPGIWEKPESCKYLASLLPKDSSLVTCNTQITIH